MKRRNFLLQISFVLLICLSLTACINIGNNSAETSSVKESSSSVNSSESSSNEPSSNASSSNELVGKWYYSEQDEDTGELQEAEFVFNDDGTGSVTFSTPSESESESFEYEASDGKLTITETASDGTIDTETINYRFDDEDTLVLYDDDDESDIVLTRRV